MRSFDWLKLCNPYLKNSYWKFPVQLRYTFYQMLASILCHRIRRLKPAHNLPIQQTLKFFSYFAKSFSQSRIRLFYSILGRRFFYANPFWHNAFVLMCSTIKIEYYFVYVEQRAFTFSVFRADGKLFRLDFWG